MGTTYKRKPLTECSDEELLIAAEKLVEYRLGAQHSYEQELRMAVLFANEEMRHTAEDSYDEELAKHTAIGDDLQTEVLRRLTDNEAIN